MGRLLNLKNKNIFHLQSRSKDYFFCCVIALVVFLIGLKLNAWSGSLKGDDAYYHVARVQYIISNFPNLNWYPQSFAGYNPLGFEPPFVYFVIAVLQKASGLSIVLLFQIVLYLSLVFFSLTLYIFSRILKINQFMCLVLALLPFTIPEIWNWFVIGGAYLRLPALPFFVLSIIATYLFINKVNSGADKPGYYILVILVFSLLALIHPLLWQWAFLINALLLFLGIQKWKNKLIILLKLFIPVFGLTAWLYLPLFSSYVSEFKTAGLSGSSQYVDPLKFQWLVYIPSKYSWSNSLGPIIIPLTLILVLIVIYVFVIRSNHVAHSTLLVTLGVVLCLFSLYFFLFGWIQMPSNLYLMSSYDCCLFLGLILSLLCILLVSFLQESKIVVLKNDSIKRAGQIIISMFVILGILVIIPFLEVHESIRNPFDPSSISNAAKSIVDVAVDTNIAGYRIENTQRLFQSWIYLLPNIETTGGRSKNDAPHKYYNQWGDSVVSYGLNANSIENIYSDDRPQIFIPTIGGQENFYPSMFWLDWFGAAGTIMAPTFYPQQETSNGYKIRPQYFNTYESSTQYGDFYFYRSINSSPEVIATNAESIAVPFQSGENPTFYIDLLTILSSLNFNSQYVLPVKLDEGQNLNNFNTAVVDYATYTEHKTVLDNYVYSGGDLIVMGVLNSEKSQITTTVVISDVSFQTNVSVLEVPQTGNAVASCKEGTVAFTEAMEKGFITMVGTSTSSLEKSNSVGAAGLLIKLISKNINITNINGDTPSSNISYLTSNTMAKLFWSADNTDLAGTWQSAETMIFTADNNNIHNQANWTVPLSDTLAVDGNSFVHFALWSDGNPVVSIGVTLNMDTTDYLGYDLPADSWVGWKTFDLPLSCFYWKEGDLIDKFNSVSLCFNQDAPYAQGIVSQTYKLEDVGVINFSNTSQYTKLNGEWKNDNRFTVDVDGSSNILWKESFTGNWIVKDDQGQTIEYYFAGPGMMYLKIPIGSKWISFEMPLDKDRLIGIIISSVSLICLFLFIIIINKKRFAKSRL